LWVKKVLKSILIIKKHNIINYILYIIFASIFLELPNTGAEYMKNAGISFYHIISTNAIIAVLVYLYIIRGVKLRQFSELCNRNIVVLLLMLVPILMSALNAYDVMLGFLYLRNYLFFYFLCVLVFWRLKTKEDVLSLLVVFSLVGTVFAVLILSFSNISEIAAYLKTWQAGKPVTYRLTVFGINANTLGYIFAVMFIINISLLQKNSKWNVFLIGAGMLDIYCVLMTFSRSGFAGLVIGVVVYTMLKFRFSKFLVYILSIGLITYFITDKYFHSHLERFTTLNNLLLKLSGRGGDLSIALFGERFHILSKSFEVGMQHFFWGVGGYNLNMFVDEGTHNQFLNMFAENGIITFVMYFIFVVSIIITLLTMSLRIRNKIGCNWERNILFCLTSIMCISFIQGMASYLRYDFWVICGMAIAWIRIVKKHTIAKRNLLAISS